MTALCTVLTNWSGCCPLDLLFDDDDSAVLLCNSDLLLLLPDNDTAVDDDCVNFVADELLLPLLLLPFVFLIFLNRSKCNSPLRDEDAGRDDDDDDVAVVVVEDVGANVVVV